MKPEIHKSFETLPPGTMTHDAIEAILAELYFIDNPDVDKRKSLPPSQKNAIETVWAYYPSKHLAILLPSEQEFQKIRTARNRNLITEEEQRAYRDATIGIAGLSVGSMVFAALVQTGGPRYIKIADPDTIELSNLNRIRANIVDIGVNKVKVAAREAWLMDPFLELELWENGIQPKTLEKFVSEPKLAVFIDEMDDIAMKIAARYACKKRGIPVVMATDNGDSVILDVERFDLEPDRPIFHGRAAIPEQVEKLDRTGFVKLANEIIDPKMFVPRQWSSIQEIGKSLSGIPQLGSAAMIAGAATAYAVRQIATKAPLVSGRYTMGCEAMFV